MLSRIISDSFTLFVSSDADLDALFFTLSKSTSLKLAFAYSYQGYVPHALNLALSISLPPTLQAVVTAGMANSYTRMEIRTKSRKNRARRRN